MKKKKKKTFVNIKLKKTLFLMFSMKKKII